MKKLVFASQPWCTVVAFATPCGSFSGTIDSVTLDASSEGVLGHFDIEIKIPKRSRGISVGAHDPVVIAAIQGEIARLGGTRAIDVKVEGKETFGNTIVHVIGTVVR